MVIGFSEAQCGAGSASPERTQGESKSLSKVTAGRRRPEGTRGPLAVREAGSGLQLRCHCQADRPAGR